MGTQPTCWRMLHPWPEGGKMIRNMAVPFSGLAVAHRIDASENGGQTGENGAASSFAPPGETSFRNVSVKTPVHRQGRTST